MGKINIKTKAEVAIMTEGGKLLSRVKNEIKNKIKPGVSAMDVEQWAREGILKAGGKPSFQMVRGYRFATCVNVNEGIVHGIPKKEVIFKDGDIVSVDLGMYFKGFHTDTSFSILLGNDQEKKKFLSAGEEALARAIKACVIGGQVGDISLAMENVLRKYGYFPAENLTGHGVGRELHEDPRIPCFVVGSADERVVICEGMTLAIEVMYKLTDSKLVLSNDGWTISTKDGKISALFEETVAVTSRGPVVLT